MEEYVTRWSLFHVQSVEDYWKYWKQSKSQMIMNRNVTFVRNYNLRDFSYWVCRKIKRDWKKCSDFNFSCWIIWLHRCCWQMLKTGYVGDKLEMLVTDFRYCRPILCISNITNIMILPPTSSFCHHHIVINMTLSPKSLSPNHF